MIIIRHFLLIAVCGLLVLQSQAQINDVRIWTSATVKHKITRKLSASVNEELRLNHDVTEIDQLFSDAGIEYELFKNFKVALNYRFINKNKFTYYEKGHRLYSDASYKYKKKRYSVSLRERIEDEYTAILSSETGKVPTWNSRTKLTFAYTPKSKYIPYASFEVYYLFSHPKDKNLGYNRYRCTAGVEYDFNKIHSIEVYTLFQKDVIYFDNAIVYGIGYTFNL